MGAGPPGLRGPAGPGGPEVLRHRAPRGGRGPVAPEPTEAPEAQRPRGPGSDAEHRKMSVGPDTIERASYSPCLPDLTARLASTDQEKQSAQWQNDW